MAPADEPVKVSVQIRYRSGAVPATLIPLPAEPGSPIGNRVKLVFDEPQFGVTPRPGRRLVRRRPRPRWRHH